MKNILLISFLILISISVMSCISAQTGFNVNCYNEKHSIIEHEMTCDVYNVKGSSFNYDLGIDLTLSKGVLKQTDIIEKVEKIKTIPKEELECDVNVLPNQTKIKDNCRIVQKGTVDINTIENKNIYSSKSSLKKQDKGNILFSKDEKKTYVYSWTTPINSVGSWSINPAGDWSALWNKYKEIKIQTDGNILTAPVENYTMFLNISYLDGMMTNFSDLRFVNDTHDFELGVWNVSQVDGEWIEVAVKVPLLNVTVGELVNTSIWVYYDNPDAGLPAWDINKAFLFGDEFDGASIDATKWIQTGTFQIADVYDGQLELGDVSSGTVKALTAQSGGTAITFDKPVQVTARLKDIRNDFDNYPVSFGFGAQDQNSVLRTITGGAQFALRMYNAGVSTASGAFKSSIEYDIQDVIWNSTNGLMYNNSVLLYDSTTGVPAVSLNFSIGNLHTGGDGMWNGSFDYLYVNKYLDAVPTYLLLDPINLSEVDYIENYQTYNPTTAELASESFLINISINLERYDYVYGNLIYNGTGYAGAVTGSDQNRILTRTITVPATSGDPTLTFYWQLFLVNTTGTFEFNSTSNTQTINSLFIDDCSVYPQTILNFSMFDESTLIRMNGTINALINIYSYNSNNLINTYNKSFNYLVEEESKVCLNNIVGNYSMAYQIQFYAPDYYVKYKNIQRMTLNNDTTPQQVNLYNLNTSAGYPFKITVVGNLISPTGNRDLLVDVQRQYLALDEFKSIESSVTNFDGDAVGNLVQNDEVYNFIVSYYGEVLGTFNNYRVQCSNPALSQCSITLNLASTTSGINDFENYGDIEQVFLLDQDAHILYQTFSSTDGEFKDVTSNVIKADGYGNTTICNTTSFGTSGTLICNIPVSYQTSNFFVETYVEGEYVGVKYFSQGSDPDWFGVDIFIELLMLSSLVLLFIGHPITIVIGAIIGFIMPILLIWIAGASFASIMTALLFYLGAGIVVLIILGRKQ